METAPALPLIEIDSLAVRRDGLTLLTDVRVDVRPATIHVLIGPNGAGKTTLLRAILGQIAFDGTIRCHWRRDGRIGLVPQQLDVDRELPLTVENFLAMMWQRLPVCVGTAASTRPRIAEALAAVGLADKARRRLGVLSGGELQRALLAQALEPTPELLLLDEPTAGIDEDGMRKIEDTLARLKREAGVTTLMVSHDLEQVRRIGDWVTGLNRTVKLNGPPAEALAEGRRVEALNYLT